MKSSKAIAVAGIPMLAAALMAEPTTAATIQFNAVSGDWNVGTNWSGGNLPGAVDEAQVTNGGTVYVDATMDPIVIYRMRIGTGNTTSGWYVQTGGSLTMESFINLAQNAGSYGEATISGGSINITNNGFNVGSGTGILRIVGSGATITTTAGFRASNTAQKELAVLEFVLDNSAAHITPIIATGASAFRNGTLQVSLHGGVLLAGTNQFALMQAQGGGAFRTDSSNGMFIVPTYLWTTLQNSSVTQVTLDVNDFKGALDVSTSGGLTFEPSQYGYIDLANASGTSLQLGLDVEGSLSAFTAALTEAGISWSPGSGEYDLFLNLNPSVSGGSHFVWDLSRIDPSLEVRAIGLVPEPAIAGWLIVAGAAMVRRRARI